MKMQVTVTIPDEIAAQAAAAGKSPEAYVQERLDASLRLSPFAEKNLTSEQFKRFLRNMAMHSEKIPYLPEEALTRESIYSDHD